MSWSGFKKNVGRATTQVMMKTGHVEKTSDREYEVEERRYRTLEAASLRLQKEAKGYLDSLRAMTASQMRIAETIDAFYGDSGAKDGVSRSYKQAVEDLDAETVKALDGPYRCVPHFLVDFAEDDLVLEEIELEWNFRNGHRRSYTRGARRGFEEEFGLMEYLYRTTVLEPINRFCAYFPDINECIKKRQHKMLDYDSMRSKVKKLTEKPDKDPGKLPRTEKEAEMLDGASEPEAELDLGVPSPPKALQRPEIQKMRSKAKPERVSSMQFESSPRLSRIGSITTTRRSADLDYPNLQRSPSAAAHSTHPNSSNGSRSITTVIRDSSKSNSLMGDDKATPTPAARTISMPCAPPPKPTITTSLEALDKQKPSSRNRTKLRSPSTPPMASSRSALGRNRTATPWLHPSELEEMMAPLKQEFMQKRADEFKQAKAAYEQLNEQLTTELPQLIDLRVPYLDPSFEALVKIQLRFCAEAYSRMAQVQQYLDASTRDQYASGDLDARVEDVLGQIRELSIAGTV